MNPIYLSLRTKIVIITVLIIIFAIGVITLIGSRIVVQGYSSALQSETMSIGQGIKIQLDRLLKLGLEIGDIIGFERQCRETVDKYENISYAMVMNLDGIILFHSDIAMHGKKVTDTAILNAVKSKQNIIQHYSAQGVKYHNAIIPVLGKHGEHVGAVRLGFPEKIITNKIAFLLTYTIGVALIAIGLAVGLSLLTLSVWVTNPINKLITVIQDIRAEGTGLTKRVEIHSQDEIGVLAASFNEMIEDLRKKTVSKDYVDNIIRSMVEALMVLTPEGKIKTANPAVCVLLGYKLQEITDCPIDTIICADSQKPFQETSLQELIKKGTIHEIEKVYLTKSGVRIPMLFSGSVMRDSAGKIQGIICMASNISKLKRVQQELWQSYEELKQTQNKLIQSGKLASIGELAAGVAHELNQPLMIIRTTSQLLLRKQSQNAIEANYLQEKLSSIENNTKRMMKIINHLRTFSRQTQSEYMPVSVNNILQDSFLMIGQQLSLKNIEVKQDLSDDLPNVLGDTNQLEQVFLNLLTNARDAIESKLEPQGGVAQSQKKIVITTRVSGDENEWVEILVKDTGSGMFQEAVESIFDPFYTTKEVGKGTGLGLSISYGIIQDHKGEIDVAETGPGGTTFRIRLPVA